MMPALVYNTTNIQKVLTHTCPSLILVPSRIDESLLKHLQPLEIQHRPSSEFNPRNGIQELSTVGKVPDLDSVGCARCLMMYLARMEQNMNVIFQTKQLDTLMYIPRSAYWQMSIFDSTRHNLFGIYDSLDVMNKTRSAGGLSKLKSWFYNPLQSVDEIINRQKVVSLLLPIHKKIQLELKKVGRIRNILTRVTISNAPADWKQLLQFVQAYSSIILDLDFDHPFFNRNDSETIKEVTSNLNLIDFEVSKQEGRVVIKDGVDRTLDDLKRVYAGLDDFLNQLSGRISLQMPFSLVYFPQLGFLISVSNEEGCTPSMEFQFEADGYSYFKSPEMKDLDMEMGDIHSTITDLELEIVQDIRKNIGNHSEQLLDIGEWIYNLDCFCSFAECADVFGYVAPNMQQEGPIQVIGARYMCLSADIQSLNIYMKYLCLMI
jgi:DNA mismatch repair protein MSH5